MTEFLPAAFLYLLSPSLLAINMDGCISGFIFSSLVSQKAYRAQSLRS